MTEEDLIDGILKRYRAAMSHLVDQYQEKVIRTAFGFLRSMEDAEDLSQEVFVEIIRSISGFRRGSALSTWIYRITINKSLNRIKKDKWRRLFTGFQSERTADGAVQHGAEPAVLQDEGEKKENRKILNEAINRLSENQRIAFVLHKIDDRSYKEISEIMNISLSSVESLMHRAKLNLRKTLEKHYSEYVNN